MNSSDTMDKDINNKDINNNDINNNDINNNDIRNNDIRNNDISIKEIRNKDIRNKDIRNKDTKNKKHKVSPAGSGHKAKISIRVQFSLIFIGVMAGVVLLCVTLNHVFLNYFYQQEKIKVLKSVSTDIVDAIEQAEASLVTESDIDSSGTTGADSQNPGNGSADGADTDAAGSSGDKTDGIPGDGIDGTDSDNTDDENGDKSDSDGDGIPDSKPEFEPGKKMEANIFGMDPSDDDFVYYYYFGEDFIVDLNSIARSNNISIVVVGSDSQVQFMSMNCEKDTTERLLAYVFHSDEVKERSLIDEYDIYSIYRTFSNGVEYIDMIGRLDDGINFMMCVPVDSIDEAASFANKFFLYVGLIGTLIGAIFIWFITRMITKPIRELNNLSERMVDLDFDARYTGRSKNEIGLLGDNMNKLSESLEKSISELKTANLELKADIEQKEKLDEMRQEFISNVSHELKTPLAIIQGYAEGLKEGISDDQESRDYYCDVIVDEAQKMNSMVKQFLNLNQLESGNDELNIERFDLTAMVSGYLASASMLAKQDDIDIRFDGSRKFSVWGDEYKAEEVLTNFFSNAIHYCLPDKKGEKYVSINIEENDGNVRVCVFNTGNNIPEESIGRLWEKFYKVDKARTREYGGSGVGLSIVKAIQESLGKGYGVENKENGVSFWFELDAENKV